MTAVLDTLGDRYLAHLAATPDAGAQLRTLAERSTADPALRSVLDAALLPRPLFLSAAERDGLEADLAALQRLLLSLPERCYGGDVAAMCADLGFSPVQAMLVEETWQDTDVLLSRADLIRGPEGFRAIEVNLHSSLGGTDSGPWHRAMLDVPAFAEFARAEGLAFVDPLDGVAGALRAGARNRGLGVFPTVALVDWPTSYPATEARLRRLATLFQRRGLDAFPCSAADLKLQGGRLYADGRRIDVVHRIFVIEDVLRNPSLVFPILEAHGAGNVVLAMSFVAELAGNKGTLAMLCDPGTDLSAGERALVDRFVPWTRWVDAATAASSEVAAERADLVLKPAGGHSAHGVVGGWSVDAAGWRRALETAVGKHFVLQRRVRGVPEAMPGGGAMDVNWGVFLAGERYNGAMIRAVPATDAQLITTSTGAAIGACFTQSRTV